MSGSNEMPKLLAGASTANYYSSHYRYRYRLFNAQPIYQVSAPHYSEIREKIVWLF